MLLAGVVVVESQSPFDPLLQEQLGRLFPKAASFSPKEGSPPHFKAFAANGDIVGFAFWTTELEPLERGYDGPIQVLVGVDLDAELTGIIVARHHEPYGYFSIDTPRVRHAVRAEERARPVPGRGRHRLGGHRHHHRPQRDPGGAQRGPAQSRGSS